MATWRASWKVDLYRHKPNGSQSGHRERNREDPSGSRRLHYIVTVAFHLSSTCLLVPFWSCTGISSRRCSAAMIHSTATFPIKPPTVDHKKRVVPVGHAPGNAHWGLRRCTAECIRSRRLCFVPLARDSYGRPSRSPSYPSNQWLPFDKSSHCFGGDYERLIASFTLISPKGFDPNTTTRTTYYNDDSNGT